MRDNIDNLFESLFKMDAPISDMNICFGNRTIDLDERNGLRHILIYSQRRLIVEDFLQGIISSFAEKYTSDKVAIFVIDAGKARLSRAANQLPHCVGCLNRDREWNAGLFLLNQELHRREYVLRKRGFSHARDYADAHHREDVEEAMPKLLIVVNGCGHYLKNSESYEELLRIMRNARSLEYHLVLGLDTAEWSDRLDCMTQKLSLDCDDNTHDLLLQELDARDCRLFPEHKRHLLIDDHRWHWELHTEFGTRTLELLHGDLCDMQAQSDVVVCSAFKGDYYPTRTSLIGALLSKRGMDVAALSRRPELDLRSLGGWLSADTGMDFRRVACVELRDMSQSCWNGTQSVQIAASLMHEFLGDEVQFMDTIIRRSFSTLRFLLEQADIAGIPVRTVTLPILGTGDQQIDLSFVSAPMISQCCAILNTNPGVEKIVICERDGEKAADLASIINESLAENENKPQVFISYSSKQEAIAREIRDRIEERHISCWMAPDSIPAGSSYQERIPVALQEVDVVLVILTPDAEKSRWVQKEIGSAIGANKKLLPYLLSEYSVSNAFRFLLDGEQIMHHEVGSTAVARIQSVPDPYSRLVARLLTLLEKA